MTENKLVHLGEEEVRLEPFSGRKAVRVIRTIESITKGVPEILDRWAEFTRNYEAVNVTVMDRATARRYYGPQPLMEELPIVDDQGMVVVDAEGTAYYRRAPVLDPDGRPMLGPDPLAHMSEEDWAASDHKLRMPRQPSQGEQIAAVFPMALDLAEEEVLKLLAVVSMSNADLRRRARDGSLDDYLKDRIEDLLDAPATDLIELAVTAGELVDEQFRTKIAEIGGRLPNALRLLGLKTREPETTTTTSREETSSTPSSETKPSSSTDSPTPTTGQPETSSIELSGVSSGSSPSS